MLIKSIWRLLVTQTWWRLRFGKMGVRSILFKPMMISGASFASVGTRTQIRDFARIEILRRRNVAWTPALTIGDRVNIEQGVHIVCQGRVTIEDDVSITPYCAIVDTYHPFDPPDEGPKIGERLPDCPTSVRIGKGTFIGVHTVILPNVNIGRGCVIGAGSVVSSDIPDYCVAAGSPARVISTFDPEVRKWIKRNRAEVD
jgi:acetyltransferase-like isoleucine patch superfamily enzyme